MPHATENSTTATMVNGDKTTSQFINHVTSYPVVNDSIEAYKSHPYGRKSLDLAQDAYTRFGKPVEPYLETPASYVKPYAAKVDELADSGLNHVETRFPIVKEDTQSIVDKGKSLVWWPFKVAGDGKEYVFTTYNDEYEKTAKYKNRGPGFMTAIMAIVSTELKITSDILQAVADYIGPKYEETKKSASEYAAQAQETAEQYKKAGEEKLDQYKKLGEEKLTEAQKTAQEKGDQAKQEAQKTKEEAQKKAQK